MTPDKCPACNSSIIPVDLDYGGHHIEYTCGAMFNRRIREWGGRCSLAFSAAVSLRAERDAAVKANSDERGSWSSVYAILTGTEYGEGWTLRDLELSAKTVVDERDALRAQLAQRPAQGWWPEWGLLDPDDVIQSDDEFMAYEEWDKADPDIIGRKSSSMFVRRRLPAPDDGRVTAVVEAAKNYVASQSGVEIRDTYDALKSAVAALAAPQESES